jgi:predicted phage terminase large subunit-like protein
MSKILSVSFNTLSSANVLNLMAVVQRLQNWVFYGACDPSMGKGEKSDPSALLVGGYDRESLRLHVIEAQIKRRVPSKIESDLVALQKEYNCQAWGFENNNAYEHMRVSFIDAAARQGVALPLVGVTATVPQEVRIESLEPFITAIAPYILLHKSLVQLLDELDTFPDPQTAHHYDGLCALHILYAIAVSRAGGIPNIVTRQARSSNNGLNRANPFNY